MELDISQYIRKCGKVAATAALGSILYITSVNDSTAEPSESFPDVKNDYWAAEEIYWAEDRELIQGHKDGTFGPGEEMTEAQFVTMLSRYFGFETNRVNDDNHWAQRAYQSLSHNKLRMPGLRDNSIKNREVTRGVISQAFAHSQGQEQGLENSVAWMFAENITTGRKQGKSQMERYDVNGKLTRAQAAVFFKRFHDQSMSEWQAHSLLDLTPEGSNQYTEKVRELYEEKGITVYARGENGFGTADPEFYHLFQAYQLDVREYAVARTTEENFSLAARVGEALGAPVSANELRQALIRANETEEEIVISGVEIIPQKSDIFILWSEEE
ncbi:S-layer homology domain-containing protein [Alteribacillus iranensis]|uniref:S-layer homology domain-containing protein n=1 Tax=Alteribacillus iranensis TaxID=930128 RepID=UPI0015A71205|nr:S-layer homology domain-containing protein [Alteribacillus iranensis]